jgi:alkanesulfonate monooxygenase SsuD/methylene tetrahydromethanopterin reductase-like flavin-dependent oxidoreductase (luciferase family)
VHDTIWFETQGRPSVFVASSAFREAAEAQARALGLPEVRYVLVPHPIQDANDDEMRAEADAIVDQVIEALSNGR